MVWVAGLRELGEDRIALNVCTVLARLHLVVDNLHHEAAPRIAISLRLKLVLKEHYLVGTWSLAGLVDQACVKQLVDKGVINFHVTNRHVHDILFGARVLLVRLSTLEGVLLDHKVV